MTDYETMPFEEWRRRIMERGREIHLANGSHILTASTPIVSWLEEDSIHPDEYEHEMIPNPMMEMLREKVLKTIRGSEDDLIERGYMKP